MRAMIAAARVGLIEMAGDWKRFWLLILCLAVGTALIAGVSSVSGAITRAVDQNAAVLMGGDLELTRSDRAANADELALFERFGRVAALTETNLSAESDTSEAFVDLVAAGPGYPLLGQLDTSATDAATTPFAALGEVEDTFGALVDPVMLDQLGLRTGDIIRIGGTDFEVRGTLGALPDGPVRGFRLGLTALINSDGFAKISDRTSPLPGLGTNFRYKLLLSELAIEPARAELVAALDDAGWEIRSALDGLGPMLRYYQLFTGFLVVVGLGSLLIGGVSVWSVMSAYVAERSGVIAVLRSLGASRARVMVHFLVQVLALALIGVGIGVAIGAGIGFLVLPVVGEAIGVALDGGLDVAALLVAAAVGLLTAFAFSYLPLVQAQMVSPASLFRARGLGAPPIRWRRLVASPALWPLVIAIAAFFWLAVILTGDVLLVLAFAAACLLATLLFQFGSRFVLHRIPHTGEPGWMPLRQALRAMSGSVRASAAVVTAVGLAVLILVVVQILAVNLRNEFLGASVFDAPTLVASDLFEDEAESLNLLVGPEHGIAQVVTTPMLRGALTAINDRPIGQLQANGPEAAFLLSGEIPMTYRNVLPPASRVVEGQWWGPDYAGEPLVSLHQNLRQGLGLKLGDTVSFDIFGDTVTARIASFRDYAWQGGIDFLVSFSPGTLDLYPSTLLAAVTAERGREEEVERFLAAEFIDIKFIAIGATLERITAALGQLSLAVAAVGGIAVSNGLLILIGSLASGRRQRETDAVITRVLGARRGDILATALLQFLLLAAFAALLAIPAGLATAWMLSSILLNVAFTLDPTTVLLVALGVVVVTAILGATTLLRVLARRPALLLREMQSI
ncbi:ABC transporter permease YtrF precursor [Devosia equisanguinis]|uniref:ABC transporter permease YtrF n=1 Tax=Devosia equisanguinis TaxID=2490941 RepID=A0A3S4DPL3_9HYPH|nr:FtsX-like permease family protein [Devosia equisanguinis]VDS04267.1 ABC transporter permease YtrF precursor [Devosia equisanguinis]